LTPRNLGPCWICDDAPAIHRHRHRLSVERLRLCSCCLSRLKNWSGKSEAELNSAAVKNTVVSRLIFIARYGYDALRGLRESQRKTG